LLKKITNNDIDRIAIVRKVPRFRNTNKIMYKQARSRIEELVENNLAFQSDDKDEIVNSIIYYYSNVEKKQEPTYDHLLSDRYNENGIKYENNCPIDDFPDYLNPVNNIVPNF